MDVGQEPMRLLINHIDCGRRRTCIIEQADDHSHVSHLPDEGGAVKRRTIFLLTLLASCTRTSSSSAPADLTGSWRAEFRLDSRPGRASGFIVLQPVLADPERCLAERVMCPGEVEGSHSIDFEPILNRAVPSTAIAGEEQAREVIVMLGSCCDQGEISGRGLLKNGIIRGRWIETTLGGGRTGRFVMQRVPGRDSLP